jgi:hypothetical protein
MQKIKFLLSPWKNEFVEIIKQAQKELFISSPYVDQKVVDLLCKIIKRKSQTKLSLITNLTIPNIVNKFKDPIALLKLYKNFNHAIFSDTILYLLKKNGPLTTAELHPLIQSIHPDICDDSIDRVINGQHFGKKWKHQVRSVQQLLKRQGLIYRDKNNTMEIKSILINNEEQKNFNN